MVINLINKNKEMSYWRSNFYILIGAIFVILGVFVSMPVNVPIAILTIALGVITFIFGFLNVHA